MKNANAFVDVDLAPVNANGRFLEIPNSLE
jgi:hypothetical protein